MRSKRMNVTVGNSTIEVDKLAAPIAEAVMKSGVSIIDARVYGKSNDRVRLAFPHHLEMERLFAILFGHDDYMNDTLMNQAFGTKGWTYRVFPVHMMDQGVPKEDAFFFSVDLFISEDTASEILDRLS